MKRFLSFLAALSLPMGLLLVGVAAAQTDELDVRIRQVAFDSNDITRLVVSVSGSAVPGSGLPSSAFTVTEQGQQIQGVTVTPLFQSKTQPVAVALVIDATGSTRGSPLEAAKAAAKTFVASLPDGVRLAVVVVGTEPVLLQDFTTDPAAVAATIDQIQTSGRTAMYDSILLAADRLQSQLGAQRNLVVFADGQDNESKAALGGVVSRLREIDAATSVVLLSTRRTDETPLRAIAGAEKGGAFEPVEDSTALAVAFGKFAQAISSQYVVTYQAVSTTPRDLNVGVSVAVGSVAGEDSSVVLNERGSVSGPAPSEPKGPLIPLFGASKLGLLVGILGVFAGAAIFLGLLLYRPEGKRAEQLLARGLRLYTRGGKESKKKQQREGSFLGGTAVGRAAVDLAERVPRSKQFDVKMQLQLDQAGWPLRSTEFILFQVGGVIAGGILGFGLFRSPIVGVMLMILGGIAPRLALSQRMSKRQSDFLEQLPDTLQLLSGSLQAGYGFLQALDTCAKEANPPTSSEFTRVLSEARLGMPLEEALDSMADRVGGEDFKWVVLAINIQRQVGGNLATLLTTVSNTLRERQQVRRQIKVLSAEGRLSAVILVALPFVLVGYLSVVNPSYLSSLTEETVGKISIAIALVLIGIGIVWMRKIIKIDV
jgi:tight adherence protein B